jgi:superfamily II DNA or RNA helicase
MGKTGSVVDRDSVYVTGECKSRGKFSLVIELQSTYISGKVECKLQTEFEEYHDYVDAGTEFYKKTIKDLICPYLDKYAYTYRVLSSDEIDELTAKNRLVKRIVEIKQVKLKIKIKPTPLSVLYPRDYQETIIQESLQYFSKYNKGLLVLMCGVGKTLISLWITQRLMSKRVVIGVPNILLLNQWSDAIKLLFGNTAGILEVYGNKTNKDVTTFLDTPHEYYFIITTYASCYKIPDVEFDMKIYDEVHHLTSTSLPDEKLNDSTEKTYVKMFNINSKKQLSLTATLKILENSTKCDNSIIISNDNKQVFGDIIVRKSLLWAIQENIICDYSIETIISDNDCLQPYFEECDITDDVNKRLFMSAYISLKCIKNNDAHHLLIYSNTREHSSKIVEYINMLNHKYFSIDGLYNSEYYSDKPKKDNEMILKSFTESSTAIICCVYCLGEGWDFPKLSGVVFSENMTSNIRIIQSALRASRKNTDEPNKIAKILLPVLNLSIEDHDDTDMRKVREVIYQLGTEDSTIEQKIKVYNITSAKPPEQDVPSGPKIIVDCTESIEYSDKLSSDLRLSTLHRCAIDISYTKACTLLSTKKIKSKHEYYDLCDTDIRFSKDPEIRFGKKFIGWIHYLCIDTSHYYDVDTCKEKISQYLKENPDFKKYIHTNPSYIYNKLSFNDNMCISNDFVLDYYQLRCINDMFPKINKKNKCLF